MQYTIRNTNTVYEEDNPNRLVVGLGIGNAGTYTRTYIHYSYSTKFHSISFKKKEQHTVSYHVSLFL